MKVWAAARDWDENKSRKNLVFSTTPTHTPSPHCTPRNPVKYPSCLAMLSKQPESSSHTQWASPSTADRTQGLSQAHMEHAQSPPEAVRDSCCSPSSQLQPQQTDATLLQDPWWIRSYPGPLHMLCSLARVLPACFLSPTLHASGKRSLSPPKTRSLDIQSSACPSPHKMDLYLSLATWPPLLAQEPQR